MKNIGSDSRLIKFMNFVSDLMILNLIFFLPSLTIIGLIPSLVAVNFVSLKLVEGRPVSIGKCFFRSFFENFRKAIQLFFIDTLFIFVGISWRIILNQALNPDWKFVVNYITVLLVCLLIQINILCFFMIGKFENTVPKMIYNSVYMIFDNIGRCFMLLIILGLQLLTTLYAPKILGYGLYYFTIGFALTSYLCAIIVKPILDKYVK